MATSRKPKPKKVSDPRHGLNATLSYKDKQNRTQVFRFRCTSLAWGFRPVYDEAQARERRSMYPHRVTPTQFVVEATCVGYSEREQLNAFLRRYGEFLITPDPATDIKMTVTVPNRRFMQVGVLTTGIEYGDHVASMVWKPTLVFETAYDPLDPAPGYDYSRFTYNNADAVMREVKYFYPTGTQLAGTAQGDDVYVNPASGDHAVSKAADVIENLFDDAANVIENFFDNLLGGGSAPGGGGGIERKSMA